MHFPVVRAIAFVVLLTATAGAQSVVVQRLPQGRVTVAAHDLPLGQLLRELASLTNVTLSIDPAVEGHVVTLDVVDVPIERALADLLRIADVNFVAVGLDRTGDAPIRIVTGDPRAAVAFRPGSAGPGLGAEGGGGAPPPPPASPGASPDEPEDPGAPSSWGVSIGDAAGNVPGQVSDEQFLQALTSPTGGRVERRGNVVLPFADPDGQPLVENVGDAIRPTAMLPFTDEDGQPMIVPAMATPGAPVMLPFIEPDGSPVFVPAAPGVPARRPGR